MSAPLVGPYDQFIGPDQWVGEQLYSEVVQPVLAAELYSKAPKEATYYDIMVNYKREMFHHLSYLYGFVRRLAETIPAPINIVETGVQEGVSSAIILEALRASGVRGSLWSVDLPNAVYHVPSIGKIADDTLPPGFFTGIMVRPEDRPGWRLVIGDARNVLADVLKQAGPLALFHHDSLHTTEHMQFEFDLAWPAVRVGGVLAADDALWNRVMDDFAFNRHTRVHFAQNPRYPGAGGVMVKEVP